MYNNIFGTDGVRGRANEGLITPDKVMSLAVAAVDYYNSTDHKTVNNKFTVVIGKDTRLSGYMLEPALVSGFIAAGADVILLGPIPTPGVAFMTRSLRADLGVVISASHNPFYDNGIKFFGPTGFKISPAEEDRISERFHDIETEKLQNYLSSPEGMGKARRLDDAGGRYIEAVKRSFPKNLSLAGMKIAIDTANGAAYRVAPQIFWELGADIVHIGDDPDGLNINMNCGALSTDALKETVLETGADIGIALDGDADRVVIIDELGNLIDGDYILAAIATDWQDLGLLRGQCVVATCMSNLGLEKYLNGLGIELCRSDVGDKHVLGKMLETGSNLGGEKSGHIIPIDYAQTGDGSIAAMQILAFLRRRGLRASAIGDLYKSYPQTVMNVEGRVEIDTPEARNFISNLEVDILGGRGRILIRQSGTENVTRIMIESDDQNSVQSAVLNLENNLHILPRSDHKTLSCRAFTNSST
ncbi:MAG: phosphoglucosamine mutase [Holosporales bacterium]|jgi:phosphoglucosamine mutase|nr:phosphoglucosamine mutase [Holosporales bacterium]